MGELQYISTPCVRICTLNADDICLGCLRSIDEICAWPDADRDQRLRILDAMAERSKTIEPLY